MFPSGPPSAPGQLTSLSAIQESDSSLLRRSRLESEIVADRQSRELFVPTNPEDVKLLLRERGFPITLFGERPEDRRERLRRVLVELGEDLRSSGDVPMVMSGAGEPDAPGVEEKPLPRMKAVFYTRGRLVLRDRRVEILQFSLSSAKKRLKKHAGIRRRLLSEESVREYLTSEILKQRQWSTEMSQVDLVGSQVGDRRPLAGVSLLRRERAVTGSWSGVVKVWNVGDRSCGRMKTYRAHKDRITGICCNPKAVVQSRPSGPSSSAPPPPAAAAGAGATETPSSSFGFCTASADRTVRLWSFGKKRPLHTFEGDSYHRRSKISVHPNGRLIACGSFDFVWHLYDCEKLVSLYCQEGHSSEVYAVAFHPDGSLLASVDFGGIVRLWDLRTGKAYVHFAAHSRKALCASFSSDGYHLATGGDDNFVKIWNIRAAKCEKSIPAHMKLVSEVRYEPEMSRYLVTASYDRTVRIWKGIDFSLVKTLRGHAGLVMGLDVAPHSLAENDPMIVSSGDDKSWKLWMRTSENEIPLVAMPEE